MREKSKAYLAGGGIGSLAAAAFIIRDGNRPGEHISLLQATPMMGGNLGGAGDLAGGYSAAVTCSRPTTTNARGTGTNRFSYYTTKAQRYSTKPWNSV